MFKTVFEVTFKLVHAPESDDIDPEVESFDEEDEGDEELLTITIVCSEELTLPEFAARVAADKVRLLADVGYADTDTDSEILKIEDVSAEHCITMLSQNKTH